MTLNEKFEQRIIKKLKSMGFNVKSGVHGASTIFNGKEINITEWYGGFWDHKEYEHNKAWICRQIYNAVDSIIARIKDSCPKGVVAVGECGIDKTYHIEYFADYYNCFINFGGY